MIKQNNIDYSPKCGGESILKSLLDPNDPIDTVVIDFLTKEYGIFPDTLVSNETDPLCFLGITPKKTYGQIVEENKQKLKNIKTQITKDLIEETRIREEKEKVGYSRTMGLSGSYLADPTKNALVNHYTVGDYTISNSPTMEEQINYNRIIEYVKGYTEEEKIICTKLMRLVRDYDEENVLFRSDGRGARLPIDKIKSMFNYHGAKEINSLKEEICKLKSERFNGKVTNEDTKYKAMYEEERNRNERLQKEIADALYPRMK